MTTPLIIFPSVRQRGHQQVDLVMALERIERELAAIRESLEALNEYAPAHDPDRHGRRPGAQHRL